MINVLDRTDRCAKCTICVSQCPIYRVTGVFPGPKAAGPEEARLVGSLAPETALVTPLPGSAKDLCLGCRTCSLVCPHDVDPAGLILADRIIRTARTRQKPREWLLGHAALLGQVGTRIPGTNFILRQGATKALLEAVLGLSRRQPLPTYARSARQTFPRWFARYQRQAAEDTCSRGRARTGALAGGGIIGKVAYFSGCFTDYNNPGFGQIVVRLFEKLGFEVVRPPQVCCGLPAFANGDENTARANGNFNIASLGRAVREGYEVIVTSPSCALMMKHDYGHYLELPGADELAPHIFDACELLASYLEEGRLPEPPGGWHSLAFAVEDAAAADGRAGAGQGFEDDKAGGDVALLYHTPCHDKSLNIGEPGVALMNAVLREPVKVLDAGCCGGGGTYRFKKEKYAVSMAAGAELFAAIREEKRPALVASECEACRMQIEVGARPLGTIHPLEIFAAAYLGRDNFVTLSGRPAGVRAISANSNSMRGGGKTG